MYRNIKFWHRLRQFNDRKPKMCWRRLFADCCSSWGNPPIYNHQISYIYNTSLVQPVTSWIDQPIFFEGSRGERLTCQVSTKAKLSSPAGDLNFWWVTWKNSTKFEGHKGLPKICQSIATDTNLTVGFVQNGTHGVCEKGWFPLHPWRLSWRFGSDHFPFYVNGWVVGEPDVNLPVCISGIIFFLIFMLTKERLAAAHCAAHRKGDLWHWCWRGPVYHPAWNCWGLSPSCLRRSSCSRPLRSISGAEHTTKFTDN